MINIQWTKFEQKSIGSFFFRGIILMSIISLRIDKEVVSFRGVFFFWDLQQIRPYARSISILSK